MTDRCCWDRDSASLNRHDDLTGVRVVVVDDNAGFRRMVRRLLEQEGFEVVGEAAGGVAALAVVARVRPGLVLLDVSLPDIDGFTVLLRLQATGDRTPVILTSTRAAVDYQPFLAASTARGFVAKSELSGAPLHTLLGASS